MSYQDLGANFRPIDRWPGEETRSRQLSPFSASWPSTLELLHRELRELRAKNIICQIAITERDLRQDGYPRANARAAHPGVILAFDSKHGPLKYACDRFTDWQSNIRAIALGLEALRKVDRYGITKRGEQYTGWRALPASSAEPAMTLERAAEFMALHAIRVQPTADVSANRVLRSRPHFLLTYRLAAQRLHPDAGGSTEDFQRLQEAKRVLDTHHGSGRG